MARLSKKQFNRRIDKAVRRADIFAIMKRLGLPFRVRGRELWFKCRVQSHKNPSWKSTKIVSNEYSKWHGVWSCFSCNGAGNIVSLAQISEDIPFMEALALVERHQLEGEDPGVKRVYKSEVDLPKYYISPEKKSEWDSKFLAFLTGRGISWEQIVGHRIGYVDAGFYDNRIVVPVMLGRKLCMFVARSIKPNVAPEEKVTSADGGVPGLFGSEFAHPSKGPAIICEGWADALHIERVGYPNAMSIQTSIIHPSQYKFIEKFEYTIVVPDGDAAGRKFVDTLAPYIDEYDFYIATMPEGEDPDSVSDSVLEDAIGNAKEWEPSKDDFEIEVED